MQPRGSAGNHLGGFIVDGPRVAIEHGSRGGVVLSWIDVTTGTVLSTTDPRRFARVRSYDGCTSQDVTAPVGPGTTQVDCGPGGAAELAFPFVAIRAEADSWIGYGVPLEEAGEYFFHAIPRMLRVDRTTGQIVARGHHVVLEEEGDLGEWVDGGVCLRQGTDLNRCVCFSEDDRSETTEFAWLEMGLAVRYREHSSCLDRECRRHENLRQSAIIRTRNCPDIAASIVEPYPDAVLSVPETERQPDRR